MQANQSSLKQTKKLIETMNKLAILLLLGITVSLLFILFRPESKEPPIALQNEIDSAQTPVQDISTPKTHETIVGEKAPSEPENTDKFDDSKGQSVDAQSAEIMPSEEEAITTFLSEWKKAWQQTAANGNMDNYIHFYSEEFQNGSLDKDGWLKSKKKKSQQKDWIHILLNNVSVTRLQNTETYKVTFAQDYSSSNYSDTSTKTLVIEKKNDTFAILSEN